MGQLYVSVVLRNAREYVLAQHGHLAFEAVHTLPSWSLLSLVVLAALLPEDLTSN